MRNEGVEPPAAGTGIQRSTTELIPRFDTIGCIHAVPHNASTIYTTLHHPYTTLRTIYRLQHPPPSILTGLVTHFHVAVVAFPIRQTQYQTEFDKQNIFTNSVSTDFDTQCGETNVKSPSTSCFRSNDDNLTASKYFYWKHQPACIGH